MKTRTVIITIEAQTAYKLDEIADIIEDAMDERFVENQFELKGKVNVRVAQPAYGPKAKK